MQVGLLSGTEFLLQEELYSFQILAYAFASLFVYPNLTHHSMPTSQTLAITQYIET